MNKIIAFCLLLINLDVFSAPLTYVTHKKLDNDISTIFVGSGEKDGVLLLACVSVGMADEVYHPKVSSLLCDVLLQKMKALNSNDKLQYGIDCNGYVGYDQTVYYFYGKLENLDGVLKNFASVISSFSCTEDELNKAKKNIEMISDKNSKIDKIMLNHYALRSLYWHAGYGHDMILESSELENITPSTVDNFLKNNYITPKISFVILGTVDRTKTSQLIEKLFHKDNRKIVSERLREPTHHDSTAQITYDSKQTSVVVMNMYWRIPSYNVDKNQALSNDIFIECLQEEIHKRLLDEQKIVSSISFKRSVWNKEYGDFCITITAKTKDLDFLKTAVLATVKSVASDGISQNQAENAVKKLVKNANFYDCDAVDAVDTISKKISAGYNWSFIRDYEKFAKNFKLDIINEQAKSIFCKDPDVIAVMRPNEE